MDPSGVGLGCVNKWTLPPPKRDPMGTGSALWYAQRGPRNANGIGLVVLVNGLDFNSG